MATQRRNPSSGTRIVGQESSFSDERGWAGDLDHAEILTSVEEASPEADQAQAPALYTVATWSELVSWVSSHHIPSSLSIINLGQGIDLLSNARHCPGGSSTWCGSDSRFSECSPHTSQSPLLSGTGSTPLLHCYSQVRNSRTLGLLHVAEFLAAIATTAALASFPRRAGRL